MPFLRSTVLLAALVAAVPFVAAVPSLASNAVTAPASTPATEPTRSPSAPVSPAPPAAPAAPPADLTTSAGQQSLLSPSAPLSDKARAALAASQLEQNKPGTVIRSEAGSVLFMYGDALPEIATAPLHLTDIAFEPGETISDLDAGDTLRWKFSLATSGTSAAKTAHLVVKPTDAGLATNAVVTTDRRTYHFKFLSIREEFVSSVGFQYPANLEATVAAYKALVAEAQADAAEKDALRPTGDGTPAPRIENLDFDYAVSGAAPFRPVRVFSDGTRIYLDMPASIKATAAPVLMAAEGDQNQVVNYRVVGTRYIVDGLHPHLVLVSGTGDDQKRVDVRRGHAEAADGHR